MEMILLNICFNSFHLLCILGASAMVGYCIYKFMLNEDMSTTEFNIFSGSDDNIYPTLSLCFSGKGIFDMGTIKNEAKNIKRQLLDKNYGINTHWEDVLSKLNYKNLSLDPRRMLYHVSLSSINETGKVPIYNWRHMKEKLNMSDPFPFKLSFTSPIDKCYSFEINSLNVPKLKTNTLATINLRLNKYFGGLRQFRIDRLEKEKFVKYNIQNPIHLSVFMTYPNQLIRSFPMIVLRNMQQRSKTIIMEVMAQGFEILQRRMTSNHPCSQNWMKDDIEILHRLISKVGCRHKYWFLNSSVPVCDSQQKFDMLQLPDVKTISYTFLREHISPCKEIQSIISTISVRDATQLDFRRNISTMNPATYLNIQLKSPAYKTIRRIRAFNEETLIGNLGGYVGLFLGIALWQFPDFIEVLTKKLICFCK